MSLQGYCGCNAKWAGRNLHQALNFLVVVFLGVMVSVTYASGLKRRAESPFDCFLLCYFVPLCFVEGQFCLELKSLDSFAPPQKSNKIDYRVFGGPMWSPPSPYPQTTGVGEISRLLFSFFFMKAKRKFSCCLNFIVEASKIWLHSGHKAVPKTRCIPFLVHCPPPPKNDVVCSTWSKKSRRIACVVSSSPVYIRPALQHTYELNLADVVLATVIRAYKLLCMGNERSAPDDSTFWKHTPSSVAVPLGHTSIPLNFIMGVSTQRMSLHCSRQLAYSTDTQFGVHEDITVSPQEAFSYITLAPVAPNTRGQRAPCCGYCNIHAVVRLAAFYTTY